MKRIVPPANLVSLLGAILLVAGGACESNPVGRKCFIGLDAGPTETIVASPALECKSRTCLHLPDTNKTTRGQSYDLCTATCSEDSDCEAVDESPCERGFVCAVATTVGAFCCKKLCQCRDYLFIPDGGLDELKGCVASDSINECCNLDGRRGNPAYPLCP